MALSLLGSLTRAEAPALLVTDHQVAVTSRYLEAGWYRVPIDLVAFTSDADGDPPTLEVLAQPGLGQVLEHGDGVVVYEVSQAAWTARLSNPFFLFRASGAPGEPIVTGQVTLVSGGLEGGGGGSTVVTGYSDQVWTQVRRAVLIPVLANDFGANRIASFTQGVHGSVALDTTGLQLVYTPGGNAVPGGIDNFTYTPGADAGVVGNATTVTVSFDEVVLGIEDTFTIAGGSQPLNGRETEIPKDASIVWAAQPGFVVEQLSATEGNRDVVRVDTTAAGDCLGGSHCYKATVPWRLRDLDGPSFYLESRLRLAGSTGDVWVALVLSSGTGNAFYEGDLWVGLRASGSVFLNGRGGVPLASEVGAPAPPADGYHTVRLGFEDYGYVSVWVNGVRLFDRIEYPDATSPYYTTLNAGLFAYAAAGATQVIRIDEFRAFQGQSIAPELALYDPWHPSRQILPEAVDAAANTILVPTTIPIYPNQVLQATVPVENRGNEPLEIRSIQVLTSGGWSYAGPPSFVVQPATIDSSNLRLVLGPKPPGTYNSLIEVRTNEQEVGPFTFRIQGTVSSGSQQGSPLSFIRHPQSQVVEASQPFYLVCQVQGGSGNPSFFWFNDGAPGFGFSWNSTSNCLAAGIAQPNPTYSCAHITSADAPRTYTCRATEGSSTIESNQAYVFVQALTIREHPRSITLSEGDDTDFVVSATTNGAPLLYQWRRDCLDVADSAHFQGATAPQLRVTGATPALSGIFDVSVRNSGGALVLEQVSNPAELTVLPRNYKKYAGDTFPNVGPNRAVNSPLVGAKAEFGLKTWVALQGLPSPIFASQALSHPAQTGTPTVYGASFLFTDQPFALAEPVVLDAELRLEDLEWLAIGFYSIDANGQQVLAAEAKLEQYGTGWIANGITVNPAFFVPSRNRLTYEYRKDLSQLQLFVNGYAIGSPLPVPAGGLDIDAVGIRFQPGKDASDKAAKIYRLSVSPDGQLPGGYGTLFFDSFEPDPSVRPNGALLNTTLAERGVRAWQAADVKLDGGAAVNTAANPATGTMSAALPLGGTQVYPRLAVEALVDLEHAQSGAVGFLSAATGSMSSTGQLWLSLTIERPADRPPYPHYVLRALGTSQILQEGDLPAISANDLYRLRVELDRSSAGNLKARAMVDGVPLGLWVNLGGTALTLSHAGFNLERHSGSPLPARLAVEDFRIFVPKTEDELFFLANGACGN